LCANGVWVDIGVEMISWGRTRFARFTRLGRGRRSSTAPAQRLTGILENWPGEYRLGINAVLRYIAQEPRYAAKAKDKYIDERNWAKYISSFRRKLVKEPLTIFGSDPVQLVEFCDLIDKLDSADVVSEVEVLDPAASSPSSESGDGHSPAVSACMDKLFIFMLSSAERDLSNAITAFHTLCSTSDLRIPQEWYPYARIMKRKIIYHGGPTNSGKTYHALQRLREADVEKGGGLYCGPLRLLALEVYEQLNKQGVYTDLLTGQEKREVPFSTHISCTLEMVNMTKEYDVAVIDEIQMIADEHRGYAWTRAVLGLRAREIHVCGGLEASSLVERLVAATGDDFELKEYKRLSKLVVNDKSLQGDYSQIRPGDCIVAFSRADIFSIRRQVEQLTPYKCAVIYGQLPPETRSTQARLFNDRENGGYDVLVASDAIGMGLNLNIRRIVFHTTVKRGGGAGNAAAYWVDPSSVKQIAGRAGRLSSNYKVGEVTAWQEVDLAYIRAVMNWEIPQIKSAGIFPSVEQVELFAEQLRRSFLANQIGVAGDGVFDASSGGGKAPVANGGDNVGSGDGGGGGGGQEGGEEGTALDEPRSIRDVYESMSTATPDSAGAFRNETRLSALLERFVELAQMDGRYFLCVHDDMATVANWLHSIPLSLPDMFIFANAPVNTRDQLAMNMLYQFAASYASIKPVALNVRLMRSQPRDVKELSELCSKHNVLDLYLWLSFRFPKFFVERDLCLEQKAYAVALIEKSLDTSLLQQKFSLAQEYKTIRTKLRVSCPDGLPPIAFGEDIRSKTREIINSTPIEIREVFIADDGTDEKLDSQADSGKGRGGDSGRDRDRDRERGRRQVQKAATASV